MDKNIYGNGEKYCTAVLITVFLCFDFWHTKQQQPGKNGSDNDDIS